MVAFCKGINVYRSLATGAIDLDAIKRTTRIDRVKEKKEPAASMGIFAAGSESESSGQAYRRH
jgi:hypothetical protein